MKSLKITFGFFALVSFLGLNEAVGQWAPNGSHIYNTNAGNVGVGYNTPASLLHVGKNMTEPTIRVQNFGGAGGATFQMIDNASTADWKFKATNTGGFKIRDNAFAMDVITVEPNSLANAFYIDAAGFIGMGTNAPSDNLHIISDSYPFIFVEGTLAGGNQGIAFRENSVTRGWIYYSGSADGVRINAHSSGGSRNDIFIKSDGRVCIGTTTAATGYALSVNGKAACTEVLVDNTADWPDYVFSDEYDLMSLEELEQSIKENNHLPGIPSATEVEENGILLGEMQKNLLEKVEELTLYTIMQDKQIKELQMKIEALEKSKSGKGKNR
ncbi:MAG TPA: hypothetical protein PLW31_11075 [Bacteroidales bacterium]|nr:hypothetical protein [Bacteroidales bacterium]HOX78567.1 hypothetical protein [Bacteroidales bacterium]HPI86016.1 hypothetical protein [Bacteroidales bacterium]HPM93491.1 hypothetical protein [Bacteroidales bacterium]